MNRRRIVPVLCTLMFGVHTFATGLEQTISSAAVERVQRLQPDPASDVGLSAVEIHYLADGGRRLSISYTSQRRVDAVIYHVIADPINNSYRSFRVTGDP